VNLREDVENMAPKFGMPDGMEARFARTTLELGGSGITLFRLPPDTRVPFGHHHSEQEEIYLLLEGAATINVEGDEVALSPFDALRVAPTATRGMEAGSDGALIVAYGSPTGDEAEMKPGWWGGEG
jgi:mannose-6-phosphate isomerase-like protein (cupin superfamily)